jgi:hypothetical protein
MITVGIDAKGQPVSNLHTAGENKKLFVEPGQFARIVVTSPDGKARTAEIPIGALGWEYDLIVT